MTDRKNIKVKPDTFSELQTLKPEGVTWDYFLRQAGNAWDMSRDR